MGFGSAVLSEEQERELAPEIEEERQIERPPRMKAHKHSVHADLRLLVRTGELDRNSEAWDPAFQALCTTSAGKFMDLRVFLTNLLVTVDFMRIVQIPPGTHASSFISDPYQRPVQFIISVPSFYSSDAAISNLVVISPHEANQLLPLIRLHKKVTLHLFQPCSNTSFAPLDQLMLYNIGREFSLGSVSRSLTM
jgi:hypothetical protein